MTTLSTSLGQDCVGVSSSHRSCRELCRPWANSLTSLADSWIPTLPGSSGIFPWGRRRSCSHPVGSALLLPIGHRPKGRPEVSNQGRALSEGMSEPGTLVTPALWEAEAGGSTSLRPACIIYPDPVLKKLQRTGV